MNVRPLDRLTPSLRALRSDEAGQSLVIVALAMTVALAISAFAIDVASWYQKHHQAQVAADAAALAAANCLANAGTNKPCTSATDVAGAQAIAVKYAKRNGITIQPSAVSVNTTKDTVTVRANSTAPAFFARIFGIRDATVSAGSGASWKVAPTKVPCSSGNSASCAAIYAANTSCSQGDGILVSTQGTNKGGANLNVTGILHSEGTIQTAGSTHASGSTVANNNCYTSSNLPSGTNLVPSESWPVDYRKTFTACTTDCVSVDGVAGVPSYCTHATTSSSGFTFTDVNGNPQLPGDGDVYCSIGPDGNPSDPSTWNGPIQFETSVPANSGACPKGEYASGTFIGGNIIATAPHGPLCLQPAPGSNCLFYSNGTIELRQHTDWSGDIFDPKGTIQLGSAGNSSAFNGGGDWTSNAGLIEGLNVSDANVRLKLIGDGPAISGGTGSSSSSSGSDSLIN